MENTIVLSVLTVFAFFGIIKLIEMVESIFTLHIKNTVVLTYKISGQNENAEMIVRQLANQRKRLSSGVNAAVYIVDDGMDEETFKICVNTASQYDNIFVGTKPEQILEEKNKTA